MTIQDRIDELKKELLELEKQLANEWPKVGDKYWFISARGVVDVVFCCGDSSHNEYLEMGNAYKTKEAAKKKRDRDIAIAKMERAIAEVRGDWRPDWIDVDQDKWHFYYNNTSGRVEYDFTSVSQEHPSSWYFPEPSDTGRRIWEKVGENVIKTALGVVASDETTNKGN